MLVQSESAAFVAEANPLFTIHMLLGMTIFLVSPFIRSVHVWSAPIWRLGRLGHQIVRTRRPLARVAAEPGTAALR
jgi:nitrate reductase gamma subunit